MCRVWSYVLPAHVMKTFCQVDFQYTSIISVLPRQNLVLAGFLGKLQDKVLRHLVGEAIPPHIEDVGAMLGTDV